jgi:molybdate transport system regulatory protein
MKNGTKNPGVRTKLFVANETIGVGKIKLLQLVGETGSISAAARQMGMNYRRAWFLLDSMQSGFSDPLFETERGGKARGGATLTPLGQELIKRYTAHAKLIDSQSSDILVWLLGVQASQPSDRGAS